jgi:hypothetical protein
MPPPDLTPFDKIYRESKGAPCTCGDPACPVPVWLPEDIALSLCDPDQSVLVIRADGYPIATWSRGTTR